MRYKLGFVGTGVMAGAILNRILDNPEAVNILPEDIIIFDISEEKVREFTAKGVAVASSANQIFSESEAVLLGVKPQFYREILEKTEKINASTIISIMAGIKIATLRKALGGTVGIVRVMPNMPCVTGKGMTALCFDNVGENMKAFVTAVFNACGKTIEITEDKFDAVTSISGSGPAYVYMFAEGLIKGGIEGGLTPEESRILALQTIEGAAALAAVQSDTGLGTLVDRVCSKGGTTIEAVTVFRERGLTDILKDGVKACREKSKLLSEKL